MAIGYANLFAILGEYVERVNRYYAMYSDFDTDLSEMEVDIDAAGVIRLYSGLPEQIDQFKSAVRTWISAINGRSSRLLTDRELILLELNLGGGGLPIILNRLISDMNTNSESVAASVVTVGAVTRTVTNAAAGTLVTGKVLDGYNSPGAGIAAHREYLDLDSQLSLDTDSIRVLCTRDSQTHRTQVDQEAFQIEADPAGDVWGWRTAGSGGGTTMYPLNRYNNLANKSFDLFSANAPTSWDIDDGTTGVHLYEETTTIYKDTGSALKILGDGAKATIQISQTSVNWDRLRRYCVACYVQGEAGTLAGALTIQFEGTGYTAGASEKISMNAAALAAQTAYAVEYFFVNIPADIPTDFELVIKVTGTLTSGKSVYIDALAIGPVTYHNGMHMAIISGSDPFLVGDKFTFDVTNDNAGAFQTYFRRAFGVQLPTSGSPTRADALCTD